jgi:hypothetical protein
MPRTGTTRRAILAATLRDGATELVQRILGQRLKNWIPAFAGMTVSGLFLEDSNGRAVPVARERIRFMGNE